MILQSQKQNVLIQKFVAESKGKDVRAIVVGDQVVAAMRRVSEDMPDRWLFFPIDEGSVKAITLVMLFNSIQSPGMPVPSGAHEPPGALFHVGHLPGKGGKKDLDPFAFLQAVFEEHNAYIRQRLQEVIDTGCQLFGVMVMDANAYKLAAKLFNPMIKGMIKRFIEQDMDAVKAYCEA